MKNQLIAQVNHFFEKLIKKKIINKFYLDKRQIDFIKGANRNMLGVSEGVFRFEGATTSTQATVNNKQENIDQKDKISRLYGRETTYQNSMSIRNFINTKSQFHNDNA